jgi:hypothetical protein
MKSTCCRRTITGATALFFRASINPFSSKSAVARVPAGTSSDGSRGELSGPHAAEIRSPGLDLWRRLRDAAESGLRSGEVVTVEGGYLFDRFYARSIRITALAADVPDFDYRFSGSGASLN